MEMVLIALVLARMTRPMQMTFNNQFQFLFFKFLQLGFKALTVSFWLVLESSSLTHHLLIFIALRYNVTSQYFDFIQATGMYVWHFIYEMPYVLNPTFLQYFMGMAGMLCDVPFFPCRQAGQSHMMRSSLEESFTRHVLPWILPCF